MTRALDTTILLDPSNNQLERLRVSSPVSGFLSLYDHDDLISTLSLTPGPPSDHYVYWNLNRSLEFVWNDPNPIAIEMLISDQSYDVWIGQGRTRFASLVVEPDEEQAHHRVIHRGASNEQILQDMQALQFESPPQHFNTRSAIQEWRDSTASIRPSIFADRPEEVSACLSALLARYDLRIRLRAEYFKWKMRDGGVKRLSEMTSSHLFFSMRMIYRKVHAVVDQLGVKLDWFADELDVMRSGRMGDAHASFTRPVPNSEKIVVLLFIKNIEERKDLPLRCLEEYNHILYQILDINPAEVQNNFGLARKDATRNLQTDPAARPHFDGQRELIKIGVISSGRKLNVD